jgi:glycosyltransferase involved in cell wall biosynthesis
VPASILAVTSQVPWPLDRGGHLRSFHLLRALAGTFRVRLVAGASSDGTEHLDAFRAAAIALRPVPLPRRSVASEARRILSAAVRREPYVCFRRHDRPEMRAAVRAEIAADEPTILYLDHLDSLLFADLCPAAPKVIDLHNVYSTLVHRTALEQSGMRRPYLLREGRLLAGIERRAVRTASAVFTVSDDDRRYFEALGASAVHVIPNGVDCAAYAESAAGRRTGRPIILYVGTLSWGPNASAARTLVEDILPRVRLRVPEATVRLVGRDPSADLLELGRRPGVEVLGNVPDVRPHLKEARVLAVPLESGGGSRLKILEAFAAGLPVVSTPVGAEGLEASSGEHLLIAPVSELADAVAKVLQDEGLADRLAVCARRLVTSRYDWAEIGRAACDAVSGLLGDDRSAASKAGAARRARV